MNHIIATPIALACAMLIQQSWAQTASSGQLATVTVTASPIIESNRVDTFSGFSTRVTSAQIQDLAALDLAAGLRLTPGVQISRYNEVGSYSGDQGGNVYIRALGTSRPGGEIKTYLDGIPVYMGVWNHPLIDLLPLNGVESIDIHKGPQPQHSGNNLGSIHLQTSRAAADGLQAQANVSAGSFGTRTLHVNLLGRQSDVDYMLALGKVNSDGTRANADGNLNNALGRIGVRFSPQWSAGLSFLAVKNEVGDPGDNRFATSAAPVGPYSFSNGVARNESQTRLLTAQISHRHGDWRGDIKLFDNRGHNDLTNDASWGTFRSSFNMSGVRWKEQFSPWQGAQLQAGFDQETITGDVSGPHVGSPVGTPFGFGNAGSAEIPAFKISSTYLGFTQSVNLTKDWVLQPSAGVRSYRSNHYESTSSPHVGLSFISSDLTVYLNHAKGILYPGAETYAITRAIPMAFSANNGWDRLSPTQDSHSEIGLKWDLSARTHLDLSVFNDAVSKRYIWSGFNAGAFAPPASGVWSNGYPDYTIHGVEASLRHEFNAQWSAFGGVTTLNSSVNNLPYAPKTALSAGVTGVWNGYRISLDAQHQSSMFTLTQDRGTYAPNEVGSLSVANARIAYPMASLGRQGEIYLAVNNLFGANYQYNAGYPMPGRNFRVGLIAGF